MLISPPPAPAVEPQVRLEALFAAQAQATPEAAAVLWRGQVLSYGALAEAVARYAADLAAAGVGSGVLVALCVARTPSMVALVLAILQAGGAYLPLDPRYPAERLAFLLADSGATVLVADEDAAGFERFGGAVLQPRAGRLITRRAGVVAPSGPPELAYVIYTSGSTGAPKGVMLGHGATHLVAWARAFYPPEARAVVAATTSLSFDPSVFEIFVPLATGGAVLLKADSLEPFAADERPTMLDTVPSVLRTLVRADAIPESVQVLNVGGEALPADLVHEVYARRPGLELYNHYGPTEATTCATVAHVPRGLVGEPPLGGAVRGAEIQLVAASGEPAAEGAAGEILIGGAGLALGYLNAPELTAARFVERPDGRFYRTGDLAVRRGGELYFVGRADRQVKVRGFRVEPGEIEAALLRQPGVERALVVVREAPGGPQLVAYAEAPSAVSSSDLRRRLAEALPGFMVPAQVVVLRAFPQLVSGKIDHAGLPAPCVDEVAAEAATRTERAVMHVFEEVLGRGGVRAEDSFFDLGGDSLGSVRAALRLEEVLGHALPVGLIQQAPSARALAEALEQAQLQADTHLSLLQPGGAGAALFCVADLFGQPFNYLSLARELAAQRTVYGLAPGPLEAMFTAHGDVQALIAGYVAEVRRVQPTGPYLIAGYSAGGLLAGALAGALERQGAEVRLVLLDASLHSRRPPAREVVRWALGQARGLLNPATVGEGIARMGRLVRGSRPPAWAPRAQLAVAARMVRLGAGYRPEPFAGRTLMVVADDRDPLDMLFDADGLSGWTGVLTGEVVRAAAPGGHHTFMRQPGVAATAAAVRAFLADV